VFFEEMEKFLQNSKQVCTDLHLCGATNTQSLLPANPRSVGGSRGALRVNSFMQMINSLQTKKPGVYMSCFECKLALDALLFEIGQPANVETMATDLREGVCTKLPADFHDSCEDFLGLYASTVLSMTVSQFTSESVCTSFHMCTAKKYRAVMRVPTNEKSAIACESCRGITMLMRRELADQQLRDALKHSIEQYFCRKLPASTSALCENLVESYASVFLDKLAQHINSQTICKDDLHMCTTTIE